jgi:hypothetical protein
MFVGLAFQTLSQDNSKIMSKEKVSVTCKLTAPELQERKKNIIAEVKRLIVQQVDVTNGVRFSFHDSDSIIDLLANFIKAERQCCSFFEFNLVVGQSEGLVTLELTGPEGTKDFIKSEIGG